MSGCHEDEHPPKEVSVDDVVSNVVHVAFNTEGEQLQDVAQKNGIVWCVCRKNTRSERGRKASIRREEGPHVWQTLCCVYCIVGPTETTQLQNYVYVAHQCDATASHTFNTWQPLQCSLSL